MRTAEDGQFSYMETSSAGTHQIRVLDHAAQRLFHENARIKKKNGKVHDEYAATSFNIPRFHLFRKNDPY
jgi:hypothetical protein